MPNQKDLANAHKYSDLMKQGKYDEASKINLFHANLSYANLSGADLTDANLRGANLSGALILIGNVVRIIK